MNTVNNNFSHFLVNIRPLIEKGIYRTIHMLFERSVGKHSFHYALKEPLTQYMLGGKLFRSSLMLYMYRLYEYYGASPHSKQEKDGSVADMKDTPISVDFSDDMIDMALSVEYLQAFLLMHDDIIDEDILRRGKKSFHITAKHIAQNSKGFDDATDNALGKVGESLTICLGDILFSYAVELLVKHVPSNMMRLIMSYYTTIVSEVGVAQMDDVVWGESTIEPDTHAIQNMYAKKTGVYTFSLPMIMGFLLAADDTYDIQKEIDNLYTLGMQTGTLFQIKDDAIEVLYDASVTGKTEASDIKQGKKTFVRSLLFEYAKKQGREKELVQIVQKIQEGQSLQDAMVSFRHFIADIEFEALLDVHFMRLQKGITAQLAKLNLASYAKTQYINFVEFLTVRQQ